MSSKDKNADTNIYPRTRDHTLEENEDELVEWRTVWCMQDTHCRVPRSVFDGYPESILSPIRRFDPVSNQMIEFLVQRE